MAADELLDLIYWLHNTEVLSQDPLFDTKINTGETTFTEGYLDALNTWKTEMVDTGYISSGHGRLDRRPADDRIRNR